MKHLALVEACFDCCPRRHLPRILRFRDLKPTSAIGRCPRPRFARLRVEGLCTSRLHPEKLNPPAMPRFTILTMTISPAITATVGTAFSGLPPRQPIRAISANPSRCTSLPTGRWLYIAVRGCGSTSRPGTLTRAIMGERQFPPYTNRIGGRAYLWTAKPVLSQPLPNRVGTTSK